MRLRHFYINLERKWDTNNNNEYCFPINGHTWKNNSKSYFFKFTDLKLIINLHIPSRKCWKRKQQPRQHIDTSWEARGTHALVFKSWIQLVAIQLINHYPGDKWYIGYIEINPVSVLLPGFSTPGSTGPIEKLKGGHEGEKRVTSLRYS